MRELSDIQFARRAAGLLRLAGRATHYAGLDRRRHQHRASERGGTMLWHWRDMRPQAMRAAELVGTQQAERRVLRPLTV
jgi:hypothetical protein